MSILALALATAIAPQAQMSGNPMVGGMEMSPQKNIVQNAMNSKDHTTLVAAVKAAGLVDALQAKGPFTVFAPTNSAFNMLPKGTVENHLMPEHKDILTKVLTYHVVAGKYDYKAISAAIKKGNGTASFTTLSGGKLMAMMNGPINIVLKDETGGIATISTYDVMQSNGVIHVINNVLMPK